MREFDRLNDVPDFSSLVHGTGIGLQGHIFDIYGLPDEAEVQNDEVDEQLCHFSVFSEDVPGLAHILIHFAQDLNAVGIIRWGLVCDSTLPVNYSQFLESSRLLHHCFVSDLLLLLILFYCLGLYFLGGMFNDDRRVL